MEERRDDGIVRSAAAAQTRDAAWRDRMLDAVRTTARELPDFNCDDVWERSTPEDRRFPKPKALGAVTLRAARLKLTARTGDFRTSHHAGRRLSPAPVWRPLLLAPGEQGAPDA